ncbi:MAG: carbohydrate ABC transporter permease [Chloroflexota bacterium]|nr:carbohydrate ABC transporter permease [Chloroflexota bacterium]
MNAPMPVPHKPLPAREVWRRIATQALVTLLAAFWLIPVAMMISVALLPSSARESLLGGLIVLQPTLANFAQVWQDNPLPRFFLNSMLITVPTVVLVLAISSLAAFGFSRLRFWGSGLWYILLMLTLMIPIPTLVIPLFQTAKQFGLLNNYLGLVLPYTALGIPFAVIVLTSYFSGLPRDLEDAARLDGCTSFQVFWQILLPLSWPAMAVVFIWQFMVSWNEFILALVLMQDEARKPLILVPLIYNGVYLSKPGALFAILAIITVPVVAIYLFMQRYFISGLTAGSLKR